MNIVLRNQVDAAGKSADELLMVQHRDAMFTEEVQGLVRELVSLFENIAANVDRAQRLYAEHPDAMTAEKWDRAFREWHALYGRLAGVFDRAAPMIEQSGVLEHTIDTKRKFNEAWKNVRGIASFDYDSLLEAQEEVRQGKTVPLAEVWDELWNSPEPQARK